ncbi:DNA helicase UvrD [Bacillus sp. M6-12]|uniref:ATP-dependent helicase n=1 Tax=Bacillus sp. M6-12 TaxID=2054166 RepID=UPI000C791872|nr:ATP-dependent helicase [Bacillus sp. M6-12]PLS18860.1 DNA helicase UvrD [Bacillus sp. M6-12]
MKRDFFEVIKEETGKVLNDVQKQAVLHTEGPLLVLASPGSGKTTTLNIKIAYLILEKNISPNAILGLTFSQASARDMEERFQSFFHNIIPEKVVFSTIHSFAFKIVREYYIKNRIPFEVIEGDFDKEKVGGGDFSTVLNKKLILKRLFKEINSTNITEEQMDDLLRNIGYVKNKLLGEEEIAKVKSNIKNFAVIYKAYEDFKKKDHSKVLLDFDDMLTYANDILEKDEVILSKYQQKFEYILTDESQDTSLVQHEIIEKLAKPQNNICVVGDDDQTLYSWRGADVNKILNFKDSYPDATILFMEQNYRSSKEIVETSNKFIQRNEKRYKKNMFTENPSQEDIVIEDLDTYESQIHYVVEKLRKEESLKETAILYRNNSSSINIVNALDLAGIPFYMKDSDNKFFSHWILNDMLNFMSFSKDITNVEMLEKVHTKFNGYISKQQVLMLKGCNPKKSVFDNLLENADLKIWQKKNLRTIKSTFVQMKAMKPKKIIQTVRKELGYEKSLEKISDSLGFSIDNLMETLNTLEAIADTLQTTEEFAERIVYLEDLLKKSKFNKRKNALTLSTFHSSKGLEFDNVYMIDLINGVIPSAENIKDYKDGKKEDMEEAVRLFYVGMTRARTHLELLSYKRKGKERVGESIFVTNVKKILHPELAHQKKKQKPFEGKAVTLLNVSVNSQVSHKKFGTGTITYMENDIIHIQFEGGIKKQLSLRVCSENNILKVVSI